MLLDKLGIAVRTGHHCAQPLIDSLGIPGTVRASFAFYNTFGEIDTFIDALKRVTAMAGIIGIIKSRKIIKDAAGLATKELRGKGKDGAVTVKRTQRDLPMKIILFGVVAALIAVFIFFYFGVVPNLLHAPTAGHRQPSDVRNGVPSPRNPPHHWGYFRAQTSGNHRKN